MATGYCLKIKLEKAGPVKGECETEGHKDELEIESFSWGAHNPGRLGRHEGNESSAQDFNLTMRTCNASPVLMQACATGDAVKEFKLSLVKAVAGSKPEEYMSWTISDAFISSYNIGGSSSVPTDSFTVNFRTVEVEFKGQTKGGTVKAGGKGSYDFGSQKPK